MRVPSEEEIQEYDQEELRQAVLQYSNLFESSVDIIRRLESQIKKLVNELGAGNQQVLLTQEMMKTLQAMAFGDSSEKRSRSGSSEPKKKKKRTTFGRKEQPDVPRQEVIHRFDDEDKLFDHETGEKYEKWEGQYEISEEIDIEPIKFCLRVHMRQKYKTKSGKIITAPGPLKLVEKSRYSIEMGIDIGISKYQHHIPLERYVKMSKQAGLDVDSQTLYAQIDRIGWYLKKHVYERLQEEVLNAAVKFADETPWKNLGKKLKDKKKRFYLWGVRSSKAVFFRIFDSRSGNAGQEFLKNINGFLMCDGYGVYQQLKKLVKDLILCHCWAHVRRKFVYAEKFSESRASWYLDKIGVLYDIEEKIKGKPPDEILQVRQNESKLIVDEIHKQLLSELNVLPASSHARAVKYALKLWDGLTVFLDHPHVPMDNNFMERTIRGPVVGRKNHHGSNNLDTAETAAIWYSIVETCKANEIDPKFYIRRALTDILKKKKPPLPWEISLQNQDDTPLAKVS
jgi:transposase